MQKIIIKAFATFVVQFCHNWLQVLYSRSIGQIGEIVNLKK